ncbi:hypothetical protein ACFLXL_02575 [Chloroflexota bacterium]
MIPYNIMSVTHIPYQAKKILNSYKHIDGGWFWIKYSAYPYIGCQFGCEFCYEREPKYLSCINPGDFDKIIKVKLNAAELLRKELSKVPVDLLSTCDYQPTEKKFRISRQLLEVILQKRFPVFILDRSPLVTIDLDLIEAINKETFATVLFSTSYANNKPAKIVFEPKSPAVKLRFKAMEKIAGAGILTSTCFMPVLPFVADSNADLEAVVTMTKDHGGSFVLAGGLTLSGHQRERYLNGIVRNYPEYGKRYSELYKGSYAPGGEYWLRIAAKIRGLCHKHGISDRMPARKRVAELLFLKVYDLELAGESTSKIWSYRKAAWTVDELEYSIEETYANQGISGLLALSGIGKGIAGEIERILKDRK